MRTRNHQMPFLIDETALLHRLAAPKDENDIGSLPVQNLHHRISKGLPTLVLMRSCVHDMGVS